MVDCGNFSGRRWGTSTECSVSMSHAHVTGFESHRSKRSSVGHVARIAIATALLSSTAIVASSVAAHAQTSTWTGGFNNNWDEAPNWDMMPSSNNNIEIQAGPNHVRFASSLPSTVGVLTIKAMSGLGGRLDITSGVLTAGAVSFTDLGPGSGVGQINVTTGGTLSTNSLTFNGTEAHTLTINAGTVNVLGAAIINTGLLKLTSNNTNAFSTTGDLQLNNSSSVVIDGNQSKLSVGYPGAGNLVISGSNSGFLINTGAAADLAQGIYVGAKLQATGSGVGAGVMQVKSGHMGVGSDATITNRKLEIGASFNSAIVNILGRLSIAGSTGQVIVGGTNKFMDAEGKLTVTGMTTVGGAGANGPDAKLLVNVSGKLEAKGGITVKDHGQFEIAGGSVNVGPAGNNGTVSILGSGYLKLTSDGSISASQISLADAASSIEFSNTGVATNDYIISGKGGLDIVSGSVVLKNGSSYEGSTRLRGGITHVDNVSALGAGSGGTRAVNFMGGTLGIGTSLSNDTGISFGQSGGSDYKIQVTSGGKFTINQALNGSAGLTIGGNSQSGTVVLAGENLYTGKTSIAQFGVLEVSSIKNLGAGNGLDRTVHFAGNNATLQIAGTSFTTDRPSDPMAGNLVLSFDKSTSGVLSILDANNTFTLNQAVVNGSTFEKRGEGTLVLADATGASTFSSLLVSGGTVAASAKNNFGAATSISLKGGYLKVGGDGLADNAGLTIGLTRGTSVSDVISSGFDVGKGRTFTVLNGLPDANGLANGKATLVKRGEGELVLQGAFDNIQKDNVLESGTLRVTTLGQLGGSGTKVTFKGGEWAIGDGKAPASLGNDTNLTYSWTGVGQNQGAIVNIAENSAFAVKGVLQYTGSGSGGVLVKRGDGTLTLEGSNIAYTGGTLVEAGTLRTELGTGAFDPTKFRFKDGVYVVNGGTLEANISDLTITQLGGKAEGVGTPGTYRLKAGNILLTNDVLG